MTDRQTQTTGTPDYATMSWQMVPDILSYFDSYSLATWAPVAAEIEVALRAAYFQGKKDGAG